jgi:transcriptional regulator with XRE-family HTH domain
MAIDKELLGKAIRKVRETRGISQSALAKQAGLQGNSVALIERGQRGVSLDSLNALAEVLDVPAACLALLGTSKVSGDRARTALVKSLQKLIVATVMAKTELEGKEQRGSRRKRPLANGRRKNKLEPA